MSSLHKLGRRQEAITELGMSMQFKDNLVLSPHHHSLVHSEIEIIGNQFPIQVNPFADRFGSQGLLNSHLLLAPATLLLLLLLINIFCFSWALLVAVAVAVAVAIRRSVHKTIIHHNERDRIPHKIYSLSYPLRREEMGSLFLGFLNLSSSAFAGSTNPPHKRILLNHAC